MIEDDKPKRIFSDAVAHGFRVFPLPPKSKKPAIAWKKYQTEPNTREEIEAWDGSNFNVGVVCGGASNIAVLDVDNEEAQKVVAEMGLPLTPTVSTSRGRHYYFRMPAVGIGNRAHIKGIGLDIRGEGGMVVGAGSIHPDGSVYRWEVSPDDVAFAEFPESLLSFVVNSEAGTGKASRSRIEIPVEHGVERYLAISLRRTCEEVAKTEKGGRNNSLFMRAMHLAAEVDAAGVAWEPFADKVAEAAEVAGLEPAEIAATLRSAWDRRNSVPKNWIRIAGEYLYLGAQDKFYHIRTGSILRPAGFNSLFGRGHPDRRTFATFLTDEGYIAKVQDITYHPLRPTGFVEIDGLRFYNTYLASSVVAVPGDSTSAGRFPRSAPESAGLSTAGKSRRSARPEQQGAFHSPAACLT